ncbi:hypothetical protein HK102_006156 [Quaeritorhiza haematococci]|nr:hypothetical protein HK102_006156 [Quaeritorhiza haematococci]
MPPAQTPPPPGSLPPTRASRSRCWAARDVYFQCLNVNNLWLDGLAAPQTTAELVAVDPTNPVVKKKNDKGLTTEERKTLFSCAKEKEAFDAECLPSWVMHFSMLRLKDLQKAELAARVEEREQQRKKDDKDFWARVSAPSSSSASASGAGS